MRPIAAVVCLMTICLIPAAAATAGKAPPPAKKILEVGPPPGAGSWTPHRLDELTPGGLSPATSPSNATTTTCPPGSPLGTSSVKRFGYYNAMTGLAVENETWTFDHAGGSWEGWRRKDLTRNQFTAFQFIDNTVWTSHPNFVAAPIINGSGSVWLGFHEDQADSACWEAGLGYGDLWAQRLRSPIYVNTSGTNVGIAFDYWYNCESSFDYVRVIVESITNGTRTTIGTFTGQNGTYAAPLHFSQNVAVTAPDTFRVLFEFTSDGAYSDEDDLYSTILGPFGMDDFYLTGTEGVIGGSAPPYNFDTGLQSWVAEPIPGVGDNAGLHDFAGYSLPGCGQDAYVVSFHDSSGAHPAYQHERITSPPADISSLGAAPLNVWAQFDIYADTPLADSLFWTWGFQHYPVVCPVTGDSIWSDPAGSPYVFYSAAPWCQTLRVFANDTTTSNIAASGTTLIPAGADSIRFYLEVMSTKSASVSNVTPLFDNIQIGVSSASNIIHVPTPTYPDIASGINAAGDGDSVVVAAGTYTGAPNRDIDFDGTNLVLVSEDGAAATIVDCERLGRGLYFHNSETASAAVDGFTFVHGTQQSVGSLVYVTTSSPTIRGCRFNLTTVTGNGYGVLRMDSGAPTFECCTVTLDTTSSFGGVVRVLGGSPTFDTCTIGNNVALLSCVALFGGTPTMNDCYVSNNSSSNAVHVATAASISGGFVSSNSTVGMHFLSSPASAVSSCTISGNGAGGVVLESNSSSFTSCQILANHGPGVAITNVSTAASSESEDEIGASRSGAGAASTSPDFIGCRIAGNVNTASSGGGVLFDCSNVPVTTFSPYYQDCTITGNSSFFNGGGIAVCGYALYTDIAPVFQNCTVSANEAGANGGGIYVAADNGGGESYSGYVTMERTIMWGNCSDGTGNEAYMEQSNYLSFDCSNVDTLGLGGSGSILFGSDQTFENPGFCDPAQCTSSGTIEGNFTIEVGSPADSLNSPCKQLIGASPAVCEPPTGVDDSPAAPASTALWPNVPNPFNPSTTIRFDVAVAGRVTLSIYSVRGQLVRTLVDAWLPASSRSLDWNGTDGRGRRVASGIYFARLHAGDIVETRKMVLLK